MSVFSQISMKDRILTFGLFVFFAYRWADIANQTGEKIEIESTTLKFVSYGYIGRSSTRNYYYFLSNGLKVRAPSIGSENHQFLQEYLNDELVCNVVYFKNNSIVNNDISIVHSINCGNDDFTYSYD